MNDAEDIKKHIFFKGVNWSDVEEGVQEGPYIEKDRTERLTKETMKINFEGQLHDKINDWSFVNS